MSQNKSSLGRGAQAQPKYVSIPRSRPDSRGEEKGTCMVLGDKKGVVRRKEKGMQEGGGGIGRGGGPGGVVGQGGGH